MEAGSREDLVSGLSSLSVLKEARFKGKGS
jgi:hypothetical protein